MDSHLHTVILNATSATELYFVETIQSLWSGYGSIDRYRLIGSDLDSVIVKHVRLPEQNEHPRGWNTDNSHQRKLRSYQVESNWYRDWSVRCDKSCRMPRSLALEQREGEFLMVMEDLDNSGFPKRLNNANIQQMTACLTWLANFHATFMQVEPNGLWKTGTYWHLATRPDELATMENGPLKHFASAVDQTLSKTPYQTLVHGDAKLANFCFSDDSYQVAAVDFQYVGGGCGMKDVAYFIGSCLDEHDCEQYETQLLDVYFAALRAALATHPSGIDASLVETSWRPLYAVAWTDFHRFLQGWSPGHWKIHTYSERLATEVLSRYHSKACDE